MIASFDEAGRDPDDDEEAGESFEAPEKRRRSDSPDPATNARHAARVAEYAERFSREGRVFEDESWSFDREDGAWSEARHDADARGLRVLGPLDVRAAVAAALGVG
jgi:hypothetical protein